MRSPVLVVALTFGLACGGYAFAADEAPQPLTRADCDAASMTWNDGTNVCGSADTTAAAPAAGSSGDMAAAQPLTRADCDAAGMTWDDRGNVCGAGATAVAQLLTRADCDAAGMKWNDKRNVCGVGRAAIRNRWRRRARAQEGNEKRGQGRWHKNRQEGEDEPRRQEDGHSQEGPQTPDDREEGRLPRVAQRKKKPKQS